MLTVRGSSRAEVGAWPVAAATSLPLLTLALLPGGLIATPYVAFGAVNSAFGRDEPPLRRLNTQVRVGILTTMATTLGAVVGRLPGAAGLAATAAATAIVAVIRTLTARRFRWHPPLPMFLVLSTVTALHGGGGTWAVAVAASCSTFAAVVGVGMGRLAGYLHQAPLCEHPTGPPSSWSATLRTMDTRSLVAVAIAPAAANLLATACHADHPGWAAGAAMVPFIEAPTTHQVARILARLAGTAVGAVVGATILAAAPPPLSCIAICGALQFLIELMVARNYAVAVTLITPMVMVLSTLGLPGAAGVVAADRIMTTGIGLGCAASLLAWATRMFRF